MAESKVGALIESWKTKANLTLTGEQEEKLKALFTDAVQKVQARREAAKKVIEDLSTAAQAKDAATTEQSLQKLRGGLRQVGENREKFLDAFDQILQPEQRAAILLFIVQRAKETGKPLEQLIDDFASQTDASI